MFNRKILLIFIFSFLIAGFFQWTKWKTFDFLDVSMWSNQAEYFEAGDMRQFDSSMAYGHPGGLIIEGTIAIHNIFKTSYQDSLVMFMTFFNALSIAGICVLSFLLGKNNFWWVTILSTFSFSLMYDFSTPPSAMVSPLIVFLCLLTLYFYENKEKIKMLQILFYSLIAGLAVSVRADISIFCTFVFLVFLFYKKIINWKIFLMIISLSFLFFFCFDPFMYFMPFQHIKDLISKIIFHYADFSLIHLTFEELIRISFLSFLSIFLLIFMLFLKNKIKLILPFSFSIMLLFMTFCLYFIFLTSHYQAERYFQPIIFIWEVFLPLFVFSLTSYISFNFLNTGDKNQMGLNIVNTLFLVLLIGCQFSLFWVFVG